MVRKILRILGWCLVWLVLALGAAWAFGALWFDFPHGILRPVVLGGFGLVLLALVIFLRPQWRAALGVVLVIGLVKLLWFTLKPSHDRHWQPDVARAAWAEIKGDEVTFHDVRNFDYHADGTVTERWETRTVRLSQITGLDLAINYWGSDLMAHPIACFLFADAPPLCFSIETRREVGESYSAIGGIYRQYELIYLVSDERDVLRLRTNRNHEDIYLYRTTATPERARARFLEYVQALDSLHDHPRWYNAITANCTTSIRTQRAAGHRDPWDWRMLLNGKGDEMLYQNHLIETAGLPFAELKQRSLINQRAQAADTDPDFSQRIREGLPGMGGK